MIRPFLWFSRASEVEVCRGFLWREVPGGPRSVPAQPIAGKLMTGIWQNVLPLRPNPKHPKVSAIK
jgi:hypothetical protein